MARTKVSFLPLRVVAAVANAVVVVVRSKPPVNPLEARSDIILFASNAYPPCTGKAPRKQLATKAARKTAAVRRRHPALSAIV